MLETLAIQVLGKPLVRLGGADLGLLNSTRSFALLVYLLLAKDAVSRERLAALCWGDMPDADALTNLRQTLANLRRLAGPYLVIARDAVAFNRAAPYHLDIEEFESRLAAAQGDPEALRAALELYRGEFLAEFVVRDAPGFDDWVAIQRERLRQAASQALRTLSAYYGARGAFADAIHFAARLLELEPWREETHRELMALLARSGQRSAALAQYETCRRVLHAELAVEPSRETTALYERLKAAAAMPRHNLPPPLTPFVGRERELAELHARLRDPHCRLLTLLGPGGAGKTRLALEAAGRAVEDFLNGAFWVSLAPVPSPDLLCVTIADALQCPLFGSADPRGQLLNFLREKELLLLLDNFEHLVEGAGFVSELLQRAPDVKLLVTSRERLRLRGEQVLTLGGLDLPAGTRPGAVDHSSAVQLFVQHAQRIQPGFVLHLQDQSAVVEVCRLVQGLPLGVELASAWVRTLDCQAILREMRSDLDFLASTERDLPERQRSLRAVFDHSWRLLSSVEQRVFCRLSVFRGGFSREAALQVAGAAPAALSALLDKSLLWRAGAERYDLHEVMRQYGVDKLVALPALDAETRQAHSTYYTRFLSERDAPLNGGGQHEALEAISLDIDNIRAAWQWAVAHSRVAEIRSALGALHHFYEIRSWYQESERTFGEAVAALRARPNLPPESKLTIAALLARQGDACRTLADHARARALLAESLAILRHTGAPGDLAFTLNRATLANEAAGEIEEAIGCAREGLQLSAQSGNRHETALALYAQGRIAYHQGRYEAARALGERALLLRQQIGDLSGVGDTLNLLGVTGNYVGAYAETRQWLESGLETYRSLNEQFGIATCTYNLGLLTYLEHDFDSARGHFNQSLILHRMLGESRGVCLSMNGLAMVAYERGEYESAGALAEEAAATARARGERYALIYSLHTLGDVLRATGFAQSAGQAYREGLRVAMQTDVIPGALHNLLGLAALAAAQGGAAGVQALLMLELILDNPAAIVETRARATRLRATLCAALSAEEIAMSRAAAQTIDLATLAASLLSADAI